MRDPEERRQATGTRILMSAGWRQDLTVPGAGPAESEVPGLTYLIPTREFALYSLGGPGPVADGICYPPFSSVRYSRFKYGSVAAAETFARALGSAKVYFPALVSLPISSSRAPQAFEDPQGKGCENCFGNGRL